MSYPTPSSPLTTTVIVSNTLHVVCVSSISSNQDDFYLLFLQNKDIVRQCIWNGIKLLLKTKFTCHKFDFIFDSNKNLHIKTV